jgi:hypothetical protein
MFPGLSQLSALTAWPAKAAGGTLLESLQGSAARTRVDTSKAKNNNDWGRH